VVVVEYQVMVEVKVLLIQLYLIKLGRSLLMLHVLHQENQKDIDIVHQKLMT
jgi:hypothetical protein